MGARPDREGRWIAHIPEEGDARWFPVSDRIRIGRREGDIVVPEDEYLSASHASVDIEEGSAVLRDCGSTNGTFIRVRNEIELRPGDEIAIGDHVFRLVT